MTMIKFVSKSKNMYPINTNNSKVESRKEEFTSKFNIGTIQMFRDNTANITGRKVSFKHV